MIGSQALRRLANQVVLLVAVVLAATALTFVVTEVLPGDAAIAILGDTATPDQIASLRQELGL
jgi:peptide/nickel transport system permease protein